MGDQKKILIIEDDVDLVEANKVVLESKQYDVTEAYTPEEGFQKLEKEKPDLVILDVMFGRKSEAAGFELARKIRMNHDLASIPILMVTAVNVENPGFHFSGDDGEYIPVDAFIDKPAQPEELIQTVQDLIEKKTSKWINWPSQVE